MAPGKTYKLPDAPTYRQWSITKLPLNEDYLVFTKLPLNQITKLPLKEILVATNGYQNAVNGRPVSINEDKLQPMAIELRLLQFKNNLCFFRICGFPASEGRIWYLGVPEIK